METGSDHFLQTIDQLIQSKHLLKHDFYQAWSKGELSMECLQEYAKEYYVHVKAFPTYLSAVHSRTDDAATRRILLQNLIEEEAGSPNHPDLWRAFALKLGVQEEELDAHQPSPEMQTLVSTFRTLCSQHTTAEGVSALYAYESQIPEICISKIDGLRTHYGLKSPDNWEYFSIHIAADKEHAAQERELLQRLIPQDQSAPVYAAVDRALDVLWNFLSSLCHRYDIAPARCC